MSSQDVGSESEAVRIGEILNGFFDRRGGGEAVSGDDLIAAHPELAEGLRSSLEVLGELGASPDRIQRLLRLGLLQTSTDPRFAARLGPFSVIGTLGAGGMGIVLEAYDESLQRAVAIKLLRPELADDKGYRRRFAREALDVARLRHPNIVAIHSVGETADTPYIVMERVAGLSLADLIWENGPLPAFFVRHVLRGLLAALQASHEAGVVHRDVKSSNVLVEDEALLAWRAEGQQRGSPMELYEPMHSSPLPDERLPRVKLVDFGLARVRDGRQTVTLSRAVLGTPQYMSPEQARGERDIDERTDLYSAGIVLFEMLTGRQPFQAETPAGVLHRVLSSDVPDPRTLNEDADGDLARLVLVLTERRRVHRPATARAVLDALDSGTTPSRRWFRSHRAPWKLVAVVLGGFAVAYLLAESRSPPAFERASTVFDIDECTWVEPIPTTVRARKIQATFADGVLRDITRMVRSDLHDDGDGVRIQAAALIGLTGGGPRHVVCTGQASSAGSDVVLAYRDREELDWETKIEPMPEPRWPDLETRGDIWLVKSIQGVDLDGRPGEEILVLAQHRRECYSRLSILDADTGTIGSTFWHLGALGRPVVMSDFFGAGHPALLLAGVNNKLDGFDDELYEDPGWTQHDKVAVVMILDPRDMDGVGPPEVVPLGLGTAWPFAYGFLDMSADDVVLQDPVVASLEVDGQSTEGVMLQVLDCCEVLLDRNLGLREVYVGDGSPHAALATDIRWLWTPLIQHRVLLRPPPGTVQRSER